MSALAPAPVPVTAPTPAPVRRAAPVRAESQPASFAEVLDDTAPAETVPPVRSVKPAKSAETPETTPIIDDATQSDEPRITDVTAAPPAIVQPVLPVTLAPTADAPAPAPAEAVDATRTDTTASPPLPVDSPDAAAPLETVAPTPSPAVIAFAASTQPAPPAPPTAPAVPLAAVPAPATATPREDATADTPDFDNAPVPAAPDAPPAPRLRDIIERAAPRSAASAQPQSTPAQAGSTATDIASVASGPGPQPTTTEPPATQSRPSADTPALRAITADAAEPPQTTTSAPTADVRANETTATAPILSTLSQGAIHATAQIAAQIVKKLEGRSTRFEMALTPDDLGRVDVSLDIDADGQLSARLAFDNPLAAADLRGRVDELRRQLTDAGFTVADDALSFDQRDASAGNNGFDRGNDRQSARAFGAASRLSLDAEASLIPPRWMSLTLTPERVDMKV